MILFLSKKEMNSISQFLTTKGLDPLEYMDLDSESGVCGRFDVEVFKGHDDLILVNEDSVRIVGLGTFYPEDED